MPTVLSYSAASASGLEIPAMRFAGGKLLRTQKRIGDGLNRRFQRFEPILAIVGMQSSLP
jgi:hypothetical protein